MYPLDQFLAPLMGPPLASSITSKPDRVSLTLPRPYFAQAPRQGLPLRILPVFICSIAEPWIGESAVIECMNAMSSTQVARCGNKSDTHLPHWPYCLKFHFGSTIRPWFLCPPRPKVLTVIVL